MTAVETLTEWNAVGAAHAAAMILPCCGSVAWAEAMARARPIVAAQQLLSVASSIWSSLSASAWQEAFASHPRIGGNQAPRAHHRAAAWSASEQGDAQADATLSTALASANAAYEQRFGRIFLIRASGRNATEILAEALRRTKNTDAEELRETAEQQRQITELRLRRWLAEGA